MAPDILEDRWAEFRDWSWFVEGRGFGWVEGCLSR